VLDALFAALRDDFNAVPIMFDFEPSRARDLTETVQLLANMCRFVIADITDAKFIPQELSHIIPFLPSVPIQPIIMAWQHEPAMLEHWRKYNNVLPECRYENQDHLLAHLESCVVGQVSKWEETSQKTAAKERVMREAIEQRDAEIAKLRALLEHNENV